MDSIESYYFPRVSRDARIIEPFDKPGGNRVILIRLEGDAEGRSRVYRVSSSSDIPSQARGRKHTHTDGLSSLLPGAP